MRVSAKSFSFILGLLWGNGREGNGEPGNKSVKVNRLGGAGGPCGASTAVKRYIRRMRVVALTFVPEVRTFFVSNKASGDYHRS